MILSGSKSHLNAGKNFYTRPSLFSVFANRRTTHIEFVDACYRQKDTHSGSDKVRMSPNTYLSVCNFHGRFSFIFFRSNQPLWTPQWLFCLVTPLMAGSGGRLPVKEKSHLNEVDHSTVIILHWKEPHGCEKFCGKFLTMVQQVTCI